MRERRRENYLDVFKTLIRRLLLLEVYESGSSGLIGAREFAHNGQRDFAILGKLLLEGVVCYVEWEVSETELIRDWESNAGLHV